MVDRVVVMTLGFKGSRDNLRIKSAPRTGLMLRSCLSRSCGVDTNNITLIRDSDVKKPERGSCDHVIDTLTETFKQCMPRDRLLVYLHCHGGKYDKISSSDEEIDEEGVEEEKEDHDYTNYRKGDFFFESSSDEESDEERDEEENEEEDDYTNYYITFPDGKTIDGRSLCKFMEFNVQCPFTLIVDACQSAGLFKSNEKYSEKGRITSHPNGVMISSCQAIQNAHGARLVRKRWGCIKGRLFVKVLTEARRKKIKRGKAYVSFFGMSLIKVLRKARGRITYGSLMRRIKRQMRRHTDQLPQLFCSARQEKLPFLGPL